jgi:hypothetical protein
MSDGTGMLEQELQKMHHAGIGISITWLWDGEVDLRLVHKSGVIAAEGAVREVAEVLPWLERAINRHFQKAGCEQAARPLPGSTRYMPRDYAVTREPITDGGAQ